MAGTPFPSDLFTVPDPTQNTGLRVNLPKPDCLARPSDCQDLDVINTLDGFNLQPRLSIPFDGPIDVTTVTSETVFLISLGDKRKKLAALLGIDESSLAHWYKGEHHPAVGSLKIINVFLATRPEP
jgi:hypothetical protein